MNRRPLLVAALTLGLLTAGCAGEPEDTTNDRRLGPASFGPPPVTSADMSVLTAEPTASAGPADATSWPMPDLTGQTLQDAQDAIQALTDNAMFSTSSHYATGAGRQQLLDSTWQVCTQNVPAGDPITAETAIDFGAVKPDQTCG